MSIRELRCGAGDKDVVLVAERARLAAPSAVSLPAPPPAPGLLLPDGAINWGCPCLGGMATGPCGSQFRDAFSCFHYSEADPKGSDCYEKFSVMQECMSQYPELYGKDDDDDELAAALDSAAQSSDAQSAAAQSTDAQSAAAQSTDAQSAAAQSSDARRGAPAGEPHGADKESSAAKQ